MNSSTYELSSEDLSNHRPDYLATIFSVANGRFGLRAGDILQPSVTAGTMVNGFYENTPIQYGESAYGYAKNHQTTVALPDLRIISLTNDENIPFITQKVISKKLQMKTGVLTETWEAATAQHQQLIIQLTSVLEQPAEQHVALTYKITSVNYTGKLHFNKELLMPDTGRASDDPRQGRQIKTLKCKHHHINDQTVTMTVIAQTSGQTVCLQLQGLSSLHETFSIDPGYPITKTVIAAVNRSERASADPPTRNQIEQSAQTYWQAFWTKSAVTIDGDEQLDRALHYNLFQLASSAGQDGKTNVSAKGLSGTGYEGHYFWDTEMYLLPFFTYTQPQIAKKLLEYRANILPQAKARAKTLGVKDGALFPWRTINGEEASAYFPGGTAQYHIDGDIAYAVDRYYHVTGDTKFMAQTGLELMVETARFWAEFGHWCTRDEKRFFEFDTVTGPDEYSALVDNNYYTNHLAQFNLSQAAKLASRFPQVASQLNVTSEESQTWQEMAKAVYLPFSAYYQINEQNEGAFHKPMWPFATTPKTNYPLLLHYHPLDIYRHQVNKQADTLLADYLFDDLPFAQLQREYDYYEQITTHDSSLSRSIFSALAARLGNRDKAYQYFMDTARMDLIDLQGNASDGLHIANLGGSWLSLVTGFGGLKISHGRLSICNCLPTAWKAMAFRIQFHGRLLEFCFHQDSTDAILLRGDPLTVEIDGQDHDLTRKEASHVRV